MMSNIQGWLRPGETPALTNVLCWRPCSWYTEYPNRLVVRVRAFHQHHTVKESASHHLMLRNPPFVNLVGARGLFQWALEDLEHPHQIALSFHLGRTLVPFNPLWGDHRFR